MVQCRQCLSHNHASAGFCDQCGGPLLAAEASAAPPRRGRWWLLLVPLLILGVAIPVYRARDRGAARDDAGGPPVGGLPGATGEGRERPADELPTHLPGDPASPAADLALEVASSVSGIATGWLRIEDAWGGTLARVPAAATREGWLALPRIPCLGGKRWIFRHRRPGERLVTAGVWRRGEDLGLWRLARGERLDTPPLAPWEEGVEILQHPLSGTSPRPLAAPRGVQSHGLFLRFELPKGPPLPSVLVQGGSIVGWTFGGTLKGGWLWNGPPGDQVREEMGVEEFYQVTFAGGREEGFLEALAGMAKEAAESTL
ncbi:MAG: hypothetical protein ACE5GW_13500, partial [Planctomycetota bacterium]